VLVCAWRPKALSTNDPVISVYDVDDAEFKRIQEQSDVANSGCMFGPEFLVYIPAAGKFATFFMGSKSQRRESPNMKARMHQAATLKSKLIETPKYKWQNPVVVPCSTPFELPDLQAVKEQIEKFTNPPVSEIERVDDSKKDEGRAR